MQFGGFTLLGIFQRVYYIHITVAVARTFIFNIFTHLTIFISFFIIIFVFVMDMSIVEVIFILLQVT